MLFRRRKDGAGSDPADERATSIADGEDHEAHAPAAGGDDDEPPIPADRAVDFIAEMLRLLGEHAFDVGPKTAEEIEATFEAWARHLLLGIAPPGRETEDAGAGERSDGSKPGRAGDAKGARAPERGSKRDLPGLRRALRAHRDAECDYVTSSLGAFRAATWAFVSGLRRSLTAEQSADRRIGHRMRRLEGAVRGGDPNRIKDEAQETVGLLTEFLAERGARHQAQIREMAARLEGLRDELDSVRRQASTDGLTRLYNRASFDEQIEREIDLATLFGKRGCLIMVDIDHFKWVNDTHGHPCGDAVLRAVAETLSRCFMRRDDFVARYGGEEFAIVLRDIGLPTATDLAERGMMAIRNLEVHHEGLEAPLRITASMGLARLRPGETAASWVERADRALYRAKEAGRDRIEVDPVDLDEA
ncbi:MAG: GGDEF domain-containing protein [Myxococcales bacterium]|nr:GGDEF domain-containing protein [Myxococcales bacterium]